MFKIQYYVDTKKPSNSLQYIYFNINNCYQNANGEDKLICIRTSDDISTSSGDSGGPLICEGPTISGGTAFVLAGLVLGRQPAAGLSYYTPVSIYLDFLGQ